MLVSGRVSSSMISHLAEQFYEEKALLEVETMQEIVGWQGSIR